MKYLKTNLFIVLSVFLIAGCTGSSGSDKSSSARDILYKEVMDVHDTCMPEIGPLSKIQRKLRKAQDKDHPTVKRDTIVSTIVELANAKEGMMKWMREFKIPQKSDPDEEVMEYLNLEKIKIQKVSDDIYAAKQQGENLLKEINSQE